MLKEHICNHFKGFIEENELGEIGEDFEERKVTEYLRDSLDAVDLLMQFEEELGLDESSIDLEAISPKLMSSTVGEMLRELEVHLKDKGFQPEGEGIAARD